MGIQEAQHGTVTAPGGAGSEAPFLTQVEQVLGEEAEPDTAFFIDSWTVGVTAASENLLRRNQALKSSEARIPAWNNSFFFNPFFVAWVEDPAEPAWPTRASRAQNESMEDLWPPAEEEDDDRQVSDEIELALPMTVDSARRLLGVTARSTREQIRAAYRQMAGRHHPDRLARSGERAQKLASDRMASINEAYRLLCGDLAGPRSSR